MTDFKVVWPRHDVAVSDMVCLGPLVSRKTKGKDKIIIRMQVYSLFPVLCNTYTFSPTTLSIPSPVQVLPSPVNPALQEQTWDPRVFWQLALTSQTPAEALHSSMSENKENKKTTYSTSGTNGKILVKSIQFQFFLM